MNEPLRTIESMLLLLLQRDCGRHPKLMLPLLLHMNKLTAVQENLFP